LSAAFLIAKAAGNQISAGNTWTAIAGLVLWAATEWDLKRKPAADKKH
jgi:hypothetical protein